MYMRIIIIWMFRGVAFRFKLASCRMSWVSNTDLFPFLPNTDNYVVV